MIKSKPKVIIICGPTASGKSSLAIEMVKNRFSGESEIISADSRQVYKGLEAFSGVISRKERNKVRHHLISFLSPKENFTVFNFRQEVEKIIIEILEKNRVPIIVGGSSFFIESVIYKNLLPEVKPNKKFRKILEQKGTEELFEILKKKDKDRAENIDRYNRRRLIRSLEIIEEIGFFPTIRKELNDNYDFEIYCLDPPKTDLDKKIETNFLKRVEKLIEEAERIREFVSEKKMRQLGLAFKNIYPLWNKNIDKDKFVEYGIREEQKYAKRQRTFLRKFLKNLPKEIEVNHIK